MVCFHHIVRRRSLAKLSEDGRRCKHCALAVVMAEPKKIRPAADPLPGGAGRQKFNQLKMVTTFTYGHSLVRMDARMQFRVIVVTDPPTMTRHRVVSMAYLLQR